MLRPRRPGWNGVENGAKDATNGVIRGAKGATNGVIRGAEAAKRPPAPGPPIPGLLLAQSSSNVVPVLAFFSVVGFALIALLFVADATLERSSPVIVTSDRVGLPARWHPDTIQTLTTAPAPAPDMTSQAVLVAQPKSEPRALKKIEAAARAARAEAPPENSPVTREIDYRQNGLVDRFSINGQ
jgi:hypothetical protein